jgi:hypothetical protein
VLNLFPAVDIPKPGVPDSGDVVDKGQDASNWLANLSPDTLKIIVILVVAAIILWAVRRSPILKGVLLGATLLAIIRSWRSSWQSCDLENLVDSCTPSLYGGEYRSFLVGGSVMMVDKIVVHVTHCCHRHGCKYGDNDCPVAWGTEKQASRCEYCDMDWADKGRPTCSVLTHDQYPSPSTCTNPGYWQWSGDHHKTSFSLEGVRVTFWLCDEHDVMHRSAQKAGQITSRPVEKRIL